MKYCLIIFFLYPALLNAENLVVPQDINDFIESRGCHQIADFYNDRYSNEEPPYAVKHLGSGKRELAAWCTAEISKPSRERLYSLVLRFDDSSNPLSECPARIDGLNSIAGLKFVEIEEKLSKFMFVSTNEKIRSDKRISTTAILSINDGVGFYFICVSGKWASKFVH